MDSVNMHAMRTRVSGEGPRLVLVGGGLTGWASWEPHAERLAVDRTVALVQLLNVEYGLEDRQLPAGYSVRMESASLGRALDLLEWHGPVDLVAWSYGALVSLDFALNHPGRIRTLTLIEPPAVWLLPDRGRSDPDVRALRSLAKTMSDEITGADLQRFVRTVALAPPGTDPEELPQWPLWMEHRRSLRPGTSAVDHEDDISRLGAFDRPALLVVGTGTAPFLRQVHDTLAAHLPRVRTTEMPAGHAPHLVSMDRFLAELERFHSEVKTPDPSPAAEQAAR
jgi:pimeloyl-ACP methyl ester carboxylesterase